MTVLDYYGMTESYPMVANFPWMDVREGRWAGRCPGWDVQVLDEDEKPLAARRARRDLPACAGIRTTRSATGTATRTREEVFGGDWFRTGDAASVDEDGYIWYEGRADDVINSAGFRIGPFEVESACWSTPRSRRPPRSASPTSGEGRS